MSNGFDQELPEGRDEEAVAWCMRMAEGRLTSAEQRDFDAWLSHAGHREAFADAVAVWQGLEGLDDQPELIRARGQALESFRQANSRRWAKRFSDGWRWPAGLAAALVLAICGAVYWMGDRVQVYETGIGERRVAVLDDGSKLSLDAATRVEVRFTDERRKLELLSGRAKFDVAKNPLRPFSVEAEGKVVVAVGTSFSVERLREEVRVVLYEGRIEVLEHVDAVAEPRPLRFDESLAAPERTLVPGRELVAAAGSTAKILPTDAPRSLSWEAGQLNFVNEPLLSAVERMNRYSKEQLELGDAQVAAFSISGVFAAGDIDAFIEGVTTFFPVQVERRPDRRVLHAVATKIDSSATVR
ncbi:FecR family protein [Peristeroidobacter soli]|uniref:FecR family protein n=1 Tax=Peristeroidobacter soli TaxID=2497877 RepID=UPI00101BF17A|nr:FecR domain-containing protein [Peristeroidobacter soli]